MVVDPDAHELIGPAQVAEMLGVAESTVRQWVHRHRLPPSVSGIADRPRWPRSVIFEWAVTTGRFLRERVT
jgi:predicted DNA-binding transcriptional regulator AlpA